MKAVIIGSGNVATFFGKKLKASGFTIANVFGRDPVAASRLANELSSVPCTSWRLLDRSASLYVVAIADHALYDLDQHLMLSDQLVVHTAGSVSKNVLKKVSANYGVLYPLQSIRKGMDILTSVPLLIDACNEESYARLSEISDSISPAVIRAPDEQRLRFHIAAVIVNNFVNHLYALAEHFCESEQISFRVLIPLIRETALRMDIMSPGDVLTGPAIRNDQVTIDHHLNVLRADPLLHDIYMQLTDSIKKMHIP